MTNKTKKGCFAQFLLGPGPAFMLVMVDFFGLGCIMPLLPFFCNDYAADNKSMWLGAILSSQAAGVVVGTIIIGKASDVFGRRRVADRTGVLRPNYSFDSC